MFLSGMAQSVPQMMAFRAFSGLWMGGIVASLNVIVAELSSDKRRGSVMGIYGVGFPAGPGRRRPLRRFPASIRTNIAYDLPVFHRKLDPTSLKLAETGSDLELGGRDGVRS